MKILQVSSGYYPLIGGVEEHVRNISERLAREHKVTVFTTAPSGKLPRDEELGGVQVRRFKSFSPGNAYHLSLEMLSKLRRSEFDIVHGHNYHAFPLYFCQYARRRKFVVTPHYHGHGHTCFRNFLLKLYTPFGKSIFEAAERIIAVSRYEKELLVKDFNLAETKIIVIPNGIDLSEFASLASEPKEPKTILCVGRLEEYKGVQHVVQVLPQLDKDFRLKIVGKGPYKKKLVALIDRLGLDRRVSFYQDLPRRELLKAYAGAAIFVLLSRHEAFAITVAEALAAKTPCIVANTSALGEWVDNQNCFGIDYPVRIDKLAGLINEVIVKKVAEVKLWDWAQVVAELTRTYSED